jgi:hypothetical protein
LLALAGAWYVAVMSRVLLLDADKTHDVFDLVELTETLARVRTAFLYEIGEEMRLRVEHDGKTSDARARVRAHTGTADDKVTELELLERNSAP